MRRLVLYAAAVLLSSAASPALGQVPGMTTPLATDLRKVPVGAWSDYKLVLQGPDKQTVEMTQRWALVTKDDKTVTIESRVDGPAVQAKGGALLVRMVLAIDPTSDPNPVKKMIMKVGPNQPMEVPANAMGGMNAFSKPDPKKLVGKETVKVGGKAIATRHYRDDAAGGVIDTWLDESVLPLGVVKVVATPKAGTTNPPVTMELTGQGKGAKAELTQAAKPMDPAMLEMMSGGGAAPKKK